VREINEKERVLNKRGREKKVNEVLSRKRQRGKGRERENTNHYLISNIYFSSH
jgi:hypothetical protein